MRSLWHPLIVVLWLADHTGYGAIYRHLFEYYAECMTVLDVFHEEARLLSVGSEGKVKQEALSRILQETGNCMIRCWSLITSKGGAAQHFSD
jgi:hypothetical protein